MTEAEALQTAQALVLAGQKKKALPLLWTLRNSKDLNVQLQAGLALVVALDQSTQNRELLEVTNATILVASELQDGAVHTYLLAKKAEFMSNQLSTLIYRQRTLKLAEGVFDWIEFSLEEDKEEFENLRRERAALESEIASLEHQVLTAAESSGNRYMRGHIFTALGEVFFSRYLDGHLDHAPRTRLRTMVTNLYAVRRWHLEGLIGYSRRDRRQLRRLWNNCVASYKKAIVEFQTAGHAVDAAFAQYGLAVKFTITFHFRLARKYLKRAKQFAESAMDKSLLASIEDLDATIKDKNRHPRNYVQEFGLDLPRALREQNASGRMASRSRPPDSAD